MCFLAVGILSFFIPYPLFIDLNTYSIIFHPISQSQVLVEAGAPIPIGFISLLSILLIALPKGAARLSRRSLLFILMPISLFVLLAISKITLAKIPAIVLPVLITYSFSNVIQDNRILKSLALGYLLGAFTQGSLHAYSILSDALNGQKLILSSRSFFGFEIYQAWVSYSAVFSLISCALIAYALYKSRWSSFFFTIIPGIPLFLVVLSLARKAAILDLLLVLLLILFFIFKQPGSAKSFILMKRSLFGLSLFVLITAYIFLFFLLSPRELSIEAAQNQRIASYELFFNIHLKDLIFGHSSGWGGYSNFFIELIVRTGIIGMFAILTSYISSFASFLRALTRISSESSFASTSLFVRAWLYFAFTSLVLGNIFNMNVQLPFFSVNFLMINASLVYFASRPVLSRSFRSMLP
jgi:hypothetical protein